MIRFVLEKNKEHSSLCQIEDGESIIYLTEADLSVLVNEIFDKRKDVFTNIPLFEEQEDEINQLKDEIYQLNEENEELHREIEELEEE